MVVRGSVPTCRAKLTTRHIIASRRGIHDPTKQPTRQHFHQQPHSLDVVEVDTNVVVLSICRHGEIDRRLVDPGRLRQLSVLLQVARLVGAVLVDDVDLLVLEVALANEDDVTGRNPNLLAHLAADVAEAGHAVEAEALAAAVAEHLDHLGVLLSLLLELELALGLIAVSLSPAAVLASLSCGGRNKSRKAGENFALCKRKGTQILLAHYQRTRTWRAGLWGSPFGFGMMNVLVSSDTAVAG